MEERVAVLEKEIASLKAELEAKEAELEARNSLNLRLGEEIQDLRGKLAKANVLLKAYEEAPHGFGMHIRHVGYKKFSVPSRTNEEEEQEYAVVDIRDSTGKDNRVLVMNGDVDPKTLRYGQRVLLSDNQGGNHVVDVLNEFILTGQEGYVQELLSPDHEGPRVLISYGDGFQEKIVAHAGSAGRILEEGNRVLFNPLDGRVVEVLPDALSQEYLIREAPDVRFEDIGGLDETVQTIQEKIAWPILYPQEYKSLGLKSVKGLLLVGPPGVGKTMLAKAIVNFAADLSQTQFQRGASGHFFRVVGPELVSMWLGNTEGAIRRIFREAGKVASPDRPAVVFFDEADALFKPRGTGISSDFHDRTVAQFNALLDGPELLKNVIVVFATNRRDLIDSAITRPGRIGTIIEVSRPDAESAKEIFKRCLKASWQEIHPKYNQTVYIPEDDKNGKRRHQFDNDPERAREYLIDRAAARVFDANDPRNRFFELRAGGVVRQTYYFGDFVSGADIAEIMNRAKFASLREHKETGEPTGVQTAYVLRAIESVFSEKYVPPDIFTLRQWLYTEGKDNIPPFDEVVIFNKKQRKHLREERLSQEEWEDL